VDGDNQRLSPRALESIAQELGQVERGEPKAGLLVSAISCWEVAMLVGRGRLGLRLDLDRWLALVAAIPAVRILPLDAAVAVAATRLPEPFHADPADRFLVGIAASGGRRLQGGRKWVSYGMKPDGRTGPGPQYAGASPTWFRIRREATKKPR
jgi:PIN domain nuclease of toxin-antitoxin system